MIDLSRPPVHRRQSRAGAGFMPLDKTKIRQRREKLGLTITDASAKAGILRPAWSKYEAGNDLNVKLEAAEKIARALRCSLTAITSQD